MCFTSAFAGVYLEKMLKESTTSVWMQNIRLALIGIPISVMSMWIYEGKQIYEGNLSIIDAVVNVFFHKKAAANRLERTMAYVPSLSWL
ncbi:Nucleotide-sugar transporter [Cooperia oncophora]